MIYRKYFINVKILIKSFLVILVISFSSLTLAASPDCQYIPGRIILNITENPAVSQSVAWRTDGQITNPQAQIVIPTDASDLVTGSKTFYATTEAVQIDSERTAYHYTVVFDSLKSSTLYAYRVGVEDHWSEWNHFKTANEKFEPYKFVYLGDPQDEVKSMCSRIFRESFKKAPDARFWIIGGDIVNKTDKDNEWGEFYYAMDWIAKVTPQVIVCGNHAFPRKYVNGKRVVELSPLWRPQFKLPENGPDVVKETAYYYDYQGVRYIVLNGRIELDVQAQWLEQVLKENTQRWTIVSIHQPCYSTGSDRDIPHQRKLLPPIFDKYSVDLVLSGHDHAYGRSYKLFDAKVVKDNEKGTVYVSSVCGPKAYEINKNFTHLMAKSGTDRQLFQVISIDYNRLKYEAFNAIGELYDSFELVK